MGHPKRGHFGGAYAKSGPAEGGDRFMFSVRVWANSCGPAQNTEGGDSIIFFLNRRSYQKLFHLCISIDDNADLPSLCLQVHTVIFVKNTTPM